MVKVLVNRSCPVELLEALAVTVPLSLGSLSRRESTVRLPLVRTENPRKVLVLSNETDARTRM